MSNRFEIMLKDIRPPSPRPKDLKSGRWVSGDGLIALEHETGL
jgi:hypothetical protein